MEHLNIIDVQMSLKACDSLQWAHSFSFISAIQTGHMGLTGSLKSVCLTIIQTCVFTSIEKYALEQALYTLSQSESHMRGGPGCTQM